jgi:hypothetical protein
VIKAQKDHQPDISISPSIHSWKIIPLAISPTAAANSPVLPLGLPNLITADKTPSKSQNVLRVMRKAD